MSQSTCEKHDDCIVVHEYTRYSRSDYCPVCREIDELNANIRNLEAALELAQSNTDSVKEELEDAQQDLRDLRDEIEELRK